MKLIFRDAKNASFGERLGHLRRSVRPKRKEFCEKHSINLNTLVAWERDQSKISQKSLNALIEAFNNEGILCNPQWLLYGEGDQPTTIEDFSQKNVSSSKDVPIIRVNPKATIQNEAYLFTSNTPSSQLFEVLDDGMKPYLFEKDLLGCVPIFPESYKSEIGKICVAILSTSPNQYFVRLLTNGTKPNRFNLCSINPLSKISEPVIFNANVTKIYKILWIRREK